MEPILGVIGGVGPYAGLDFLKKIFDNTDAAKDQDHIGCILVSCPALIPDRSEFLLNGAIPADRNPAYGMFQCAEKLYAAGARYLAVACNTAHAGRIFAPFRAMVNDSLPDMAVVNMLETCASAIKERKDRDPYRRIGLLATKGTHASGVYHEYFKVTDGFTLIEPELSVRERVHDAIYNEVYGIKACARPVSGKARGILAAAVGGLANRGAQAVILGCTELPLGVDAAVFPFPLIDPALFAARRMIALAAPEKLLCNPQAVIDSRRCTRPS
jgi:aspartate racemase